MARTSGSRSVSIRSGVPGIRGTYQDLTTADKALEESIAAAQLVADRVAGIQSFLLAQSPLAEVDGVYVDVKSRRIATDSNGQPLRAAESKTKR